MGGLAKEAAPGVWTVSERLEPTLRELGERGDIIKAMNRALSRRGQERDPMSYRVHDSAPAEPVVGRVIGKGLTDELSDRIGLVIDGVDGRVHHVEVDGAAALKEVRVGSIVEAGPRVQGRPADRAIAELARGIGEYRPSQHRRLIDSGDVRLPKGANPDAFVDSDVTP
jgi:hypothetical protein